MRPLAACDFSMLFICFLTAFRGTWHTARPSRLALYSQASGQSHLDKWLRINQLHRLSRCRGRDSLAQRSGQWCYKSPQFVRNKGRFGGTAGWDNLSHVGGRFLGFPAGHIQEQSTGERNLVIGEAGGGGVERKKLTYSKDDNPISVQAPRFIVQALASVRVTGAKAHSIHASHAQTVECLVTEVRRIEHAPDSDAPRR